MKYNLPKGYLSYSQVHLWMTNKSAYRKKYYEGEPSFETVETIFGKKIARIMEDPKEIKKYPTLKKVPRYKVSEYNIEVTIANIPIKGYLDSFRPKDLSFLEFKSGHTNKDGKPPWNKVKVSKHDQLPFYSLLIEKKHNKVNRVCHLVWIETRFKEKTVKFMGHTLTADSRELELTGQIKIFKRIIPKWERERMRKLIVKTAKEIHKDFTAYEQKRNIEVL